MPQFKFNTISRTDIENSLGGAQMILAIDYDGPNNLLVTGCAGSGKTTVSLMRAERLVNLKKDVFIVTLHDLLVTSLRNSASVDLAPRIIKYHGWYYKASESHAHEKTYDEMVEELKDYEEIDEFIVDEGQNFSEAFHKILLSKCGKISVGADNAQQIHRGLTVEQIKVGILNKGTLTPIPLQYNYRNTYEIYNFARYFLPLNERANNNLAIERIPKGRSAKPTVFLVPDEGTELAQLYTLLRDGGDRNIAVLLYHIPDVVRYHQIITDFGISCSIHHSSNHVANDMENVLITTYKSAQGLEFQTVILPGMESAMEKWYQYPEHYYIGCTRAKENLYVIAKGDDLPDYFGEFDDGSYDLNTPEKQDAPKKINTPKPDEEDDLPF
jgi:superfamily I DNA/RNA helicase